jgi:DNA-binding IclR family transcriptional regulator
MGRPWTLQLAALGMDCLRMLQTIPEPKLSELSEPIERLEAAVAALHALVQALMQPGWLHEYAKGNLSSRKCITTHQAIIQVSSATRAPTPPYSSFLPRTLTAHRVAADCGGT